MISKQRKKGKERHTCTHVQIKRDFFKEYDTSSKISSLVHFSFVGKQKTILILISTQTTKHSPKN